MTNPRDPFLLVCLVLISLGSLSTVAAEEPPGGAAPVKVFILMGQSNMVGMGDISGGSSRWGKQFIDPVVSVYAGAYSPETDYDRATPIETMALPAFGGVRPTPYPGGGTRKDWPSSWPEGTKPEPIDWYAGKQYDDFVKATHEVLDGFGELFPAERDRGYEVAGFVWWQGHKDGNEAHASRYEQNLVRLIKSLRQEFRAPKAPFVLATIAFGGWEMAGPHLTVANAQLAVSGETGKYPEFAGNVLAVETRDFWRKVEDSPRNQGYHYNRNAETYMLVGEALGRGMVRLLEQAGR